MTPRLLPALWLAMLLAIAPAGAQTLENHGLSVRFDAGTGAIAGITNRLTGESYEVRGTPFILQTSRGELKAAAGIVDQAASGVQFRYEFPAGVRVVVNYTAPAGLDFLQKRIEVANTGSQPLTIHKVTAEHWTVKPAFLQVHRHNDPSQFAWLINVYFRGKRGGLYAGIENPVQEFWLRGHDPASTMGQFDFRPNAIVAPGQTWTADPFFAGAFQYEGVYLFKELGKLKDALRRPKAVPTALNFEQEILDWGEVWAMQDFMRAMQPPHDFGKPGFYVRVVAMVGGKATGVMGEEAGFHIAFKPEHVAGSKRFIDEIVKLGHVPHVEWATEWFGVGGYANPTKDFLLENAGPGEKPPVNPHWREVVEYGWKKGVQASIFETVGRNFARKVSEWKLRRRDGSLWDYRGEGVNCWANPEYAQWRLKVTDEAIRDFNLYMVAWDAIVPADWSWLGWPAIETVCHATNHGHVPGDITYPVFRNIQWFVGELQKRHPKAALRAASGLTTAYPWVLKDLIEYHPNFYDGETGATYWTSYNFRFLPMYKSGVLLSAKTRKEFEWLLLRSISVSDHFMLWPDAVPIATEHKDFWTKWLKWANDNIEYLRVGRTLFREPWGDHMVASLPPALEGALPADHAAIHGSAHCIKDRGYVFLFNPSERARVASMPVNHWLGLTEGEAFEVSEIYPGGAAYGPYKRGEELRIELPANSMGVYKIEPARSAAGRSPRRPRVSAGAPVDKAFLKWDEIPWAEINVRPSETVSAIPR